MIDYLADLLQQSQLRAQVRNLARKYLQVRILSPLQSGWQSGIVTEASRRESVRQRLRVLN